MSDDISAEIGVIGGSGLYEFLDDAVTVDVPTPFGPPSDPLVLGAVAGRRVAFVPRYGAAVSELASEPWAPNGATASATHTSLTP